MDAILPFIQSHEHYDVQGQLSNLYLKKIVKENHQHEIQQLCFSQHHPNLLASVGGTQASIYDNENCGEHLDIMLNFVNMDTPALLKELATCPSLPSTNTPSGHSISTTTREFQKAYGTNLLKGSLNGTKPEIEKNDQFEQMQQVVDEGGFDEDIYIGISKKNNPVVLETHKEEEEKTEMENGEKSVKTLMLSGAPVSLPSHHHNTSNTSITPNKRQMQGIGRDVEVFDREDRQLNCVAWFAFPARKPLPIHSIRRLLSKDDSKSSTPSNSTDTGGENPNRLNGTFDVDISRVDRTDAWIAVGGEDTLVQLISIAHCKSLYVLPGHYEPVLKLAAGRHSTALSSLSAHRIILWNMPLLARHHYNACHSGGTGLEYLLDCYEDIQDDQNVSSNSGPSSSNIVSHIQKLPNITREHRKWVLQDFKVPGEGLHCLSFCHLGLLAGGSNGQLYLWRWIKNIGCEDEEGDLGPRAINGKRMSDGKNFPAPIWNPLPNRLLEAVPERIVWPYPNDTIDHIVPKMDSPESPGHAVLVRSQNGRLLLWTIDSHSGALASTIPLDSNTTQVMKGSLSFKMTAITVLMEYKGLKTQTQMHLGGSSLLPSDPTALTYSSRPLKGLDITACGRYACVSNEKGEVQIIDLGNGEEVALLGHKRSKSPITSCLFAHHSRNVVYSSESIIWRWDFISPQTLQKERKEQAIAEAEGIDLPLSDDEESV